ncbi:MAG: DUF561 domain-containing protein [Gammaproteobacteria bacterium]|nr:DUF561 domain-containing protein [Gammaproteobacteria bacterium]
MGKKTDIWPDGRVKNLLGVEHPVVQAPMASASTPALVAAVSNAGGLGSFGAAATPPERLRAIVSEIRRLTDRPFNVNLFAPGVEQASASDAQTQRMRDILLPYYDQLGVACPNDVAAPIGPFDEQFEVLLEERVPVFSFHFGPPPEDAIRRMKAAGSAVMASATNLAEALELEAAGVDIIIAQGSEAGGHRGTYAMPLEQSLIGTTALVPLIADAVEVPVIAAGGVMDGRGIRAVMALGASGVQMGTAFLGCPENEIPDAYRRAVLSARGDMTAITRVFSGRPARAIQNRFMEEMAHQDGFLLPFPLQMAYVGPLRKAGAERSNPDFISMWAGQGVGLARALPAGELLACLVKEFVKAATPRAAS